MENALTLLGESESKPGFILSTGSPSLDALLGGGVYSGELTEVFGAFTTGKSQLAMSVSLQAVFFPSVSCPTLGRVWYLDSGSNFSPVRFAQMFEHNLTDKDRLADANEKLEACMKVLERVQLFDVHNAFQVLNILSQLNFLLQETLKNIPNTNPHLIPSGTLPKIDGLNLVVIDALGVLLSPLTTMKHKFGRAIMVEIAQLMRSIATTYNIAFLIINHSSTSELSAPNAAQSSHRTNHHPYHQQYHQGGATTSSNRPSSSPQIPMHQPALGKYWSYIPSVQLMLKYPSRDYILEMGGRVAELRKSTHAPSGAKVDFTISIKGVDEALGL